MLLNIKKLKSNIDKFEVYCYDKRAEKITKALKKIFNKLGYKDSKLASDLLNFYNNIQDSDATYQCFVEVLYNSFEDGIDTLKEISEF